MRMRKVLLVIDEIQQLIGLEAFLRRLGFDVLSLGKDSLVADALLGFQPDIVIASHRGRNVDGLKLATRLKKMMVPTPRIVISYSGSAPVIAKDDQRSIDALLEISVLGEAAIRLIAQLSGLAVEPILDKYRKFASARLTKDEQIVIIAAKTAANTAASSKHRGSSAEVKTARSTGYDQILKNHAKDLANGAADKVMPRERAAQLMAKLKQDSSADKQLLDKIQAQKIKFAEAMFSEPDAQSKPVQPAEPVSKAPATKASQSKS